MGKKTIKAARKTIVVSSSKPLTKEEKTIQSLMKSGYTRVEAQQYLLQHPNTAISPKNPKRGNTGIEILPPFTLPKPKKPKKLDLKRWKVVVLIDNSHKLEGVIFTPSKLKPVDGYFFVSFYSAETFLRDQVENPDSLYETLKYEIKKCSAICKKGGVSFISENKEKELASVYGRRLLCDYIDKALTQRPKKEKATETEDVFLDRRFKYEKKKKKKERKDFSAETTVQTLECA